MFKGQLLGRFIQSRFGISIGRLLNANIAIVRNDCFGCHFTVAITAVVRAASESNRIGNAIFNILFQIGGIVLLRSFTC